MPTTNPVLPSTKSPVPGYEDRGCGEATWHMDVEVRAPYQGMDRYAETLPPILGAYEANDSDLDVALSVLYQDENLDRISSAIGGAQEILNRYQQGGYIGAGNVSAIKEYITRAGKYLIEARGLKSLWEKYQTEAGSPNWPLIEASMSGCVGLLAPERGSALGFGGGGGAAPVSWVCPKMGDAARHGADREKFRDLVYAAMVNARCAQEAAAAVGINGRNKEAKAPSRGPGIGGMAVAPSGPSMSLVAASEPTGTPTMDVSPQDVAEDEPAPTKKKKDNTMLLVGAAVLGIVVLSKK